MANLDLIPNYKTSWIGNTWGGGTSWMQDFIVDFIVDANGRCYTDSPWDEGHNERGEYWWNGSKWNVKVNRIQDAPQVSNKSIIINNVTWTVNTDGSVISSNGKKLPNLVFATGLGLYIPKNYLMVTDDGKDQHVVKFYNVSGNDPVLVKSFGMVGGIGAGTPGQVIPTKFWGLMGCGSDLTGNIYVAMSEEGPLIRRFAVLDPFNLIFDEINVPEAHGFHFLESCDFDSTTDGLHIYGKQEHYIMDYSKPAGQQYKLVGYTFDKDRYPNDPRHKPSDPRQGCTKIRYKNGKKFLFQLGQKEFAINIYKFDGEIAVFFMSIPELMVSIDDNCDIWFIGDWVTVMRCTGVDSNGNLTYASRSDFCPRPQPFNKLTHILFDSEHDEMYLAGGTPEKQTQGWGHPGPVVCKYKNWSSTMDLAWSIILPFRHEELPVSDRIVPEGWDFAGERLYIGYVVHDDSERLPAPYNDSPGPIRVYNTRNGSFIGRLLPGPEVFYNSSWLDMAHVVSAFERSNGQHVIIREEAWKNKNILYTYFPDGNGGNTTIKKVTLNKLTSGKVFMNTASIEFSADVELTSGSITKIELYANNQLVGTSSNPPFTFSASNLAVGEEVMVRAVVYDNGGNKAFSNRIYVKISDGTPEVSIVSPLPKAIFLKTDAIPVKVSHVDFDGSIVKVEYFSNGVKIGEKGNPNELFVWNNPSVGNVQLTAKVTDNQSRVGTSKPLSLTVWDYKVAENVTNATQGVNYRYYEGNFSVLPNYDTLTPILTGTQSDFSLSKAQKTGNFGFRFDGFIKVDTAGLYTFYTNSDDGSKLFIGNNLIVNNDGSHGAKEESGRILLNPGYHKYILDFAQGEGGLSLTVSYEGPNISKRVIPNDKLFKGSLVTVPPVPAPKVVKAVSRRVHGTKGTFDMPISVNPNDVVESIPIECRSGTKQIVVVEFDRPISNANLVIEPAAGKKAVFESWVQNTPTTFTITINTVSDAQLLKLIINNIKGIDGTTGGTSLVRFRILTGDLDGDGIVSQNDKELMEGYLNLTNRSYRYDINVSGSVNDQDLTAIKNRLGWKV